MIPPNPVYDALTRVATCVCSEILNPEWGVPDVCFCGVVPGDAAVGEFAGDCASKCGMAWVRMVSFYPSNSVGAQAMDLTTCDAGMGIDMEVGIMRCISVGDERGNMPSAAELLAASELQITDALLMRKAILCCGFERNDVILGQYTPLGPEGGLVGGSWLLSAAI